MSISTKEKELLKEAEDWEKHLRGTDSKSISKDKEESLERRLGLQLISLRLPSNLISELKEIASSEGLGYQPYVRRLLMKHVQSKKDASHTSRKTSMKQTLSK